MIAPSSSAPERALSSTKPHASIFLATGCGLGYLPQAPGTWGSLAGLFAAAVPWLFLHSIGIVSRDVQIGTVSILRSRQFDPYLAAQICISLIIGALGVWSASVASRYWSEDDPQRVVIDEISGQHLTLLLGCAVPVPWRPSPNWIDTQFGFVTLNSALNWKYLLVGLILFRTFDIWKPFPARQAESLPGGWGIMADDWIAGVYAAVGLWLVRALGL